MWSALTGGRSAVTCWFCHERTRLPRSAADADTKNDWHCSSCGNRNAFDAHGNLVDAWPEMYRETPLASRSRPAAHGELGAGAAFCPSCQRNQELVCQMLAAYLPDEDDPDYQSRFAQADEYARSLKRRYPLVCRKCQVRVDERLQQQAQWMYRRELGSALRRSENARSQPAHVLPSLRRRRAVVTWTACAAVALVVAPLAAWSWYYSLLTGWRAPAGVATAAGVALALLTYVSRVLNPLWLYTACHPGVRASGLPLYRRRVAHLSLLRLLSAALQPTVTHPAVWTIALLGDLVLCLRAARSLHTYDGRRPPSRQSRQAAEHDPRAAAAQLDNDSEPAVLATDKNAEVALSSLRSLSFGASEANMDQDDSLLGSGFGSRLGSALPDPWQRRPSTAPRGRRRHMLGADSGDDDDDGDAIDTGILSGLDTLSFGAQTKSAAAGASNVGDELAALLGGGGTSASTSNTAGLFRRSKANDTRPPSMPRRPFEAHAFSRDRTTGLETRMSAFSIDDGSDQGLFGSSTVDSRLLAALGRLAMPRAIVAGCVVASWLLAAQTPSQILWLPRLALLAVMRAAVSATPRTAVLRRVWGCAVCVGLVCVPAWLSLRSAGAWVLPGAMVPSAAALLRWPLARQQASESLRGLGYGTHPPGLGHGIEQHAWPALPLPIQLDCAAELAGLAFLAFP